MKIQPYKKWKGKNHEKTIYCNIISRRTID